MYHVHLEISLIRKDLDTLWGRMAVVEQRISLVEDVQRDHSVDLHTFKIKMKCLELRVEDPKNCNQRNNLCILGVPKVSEGTDPTLFTENILKTLLPRTKFLPFFAVASYPPY